MGLPAAQEAVCRPGSRLVLSSTDLNRSSKCGLEVRRIIRQGDCVSVGSGPIIFCSERERPQCKSA